VARNAPLRELRCPQERGVFRRNPQFTSRARKRSRNVLWYGVAAAEGGHVGPGDVQRGRGHGATSWMRMMIGRGKGEVKWKSGVR